MIPRCAGLSAEKPLQDALLRQAKWGVLRRNGSRGNLSTLTDLSGQWIDAVHGRRPSRGVVLDMDSSGSPTHGEQEMSVPNGQYACTCYPRPDTYPEIGDLPADPVPRCIKVQICRCIKVSV